MNVRGQFPTQFSTGGQERYDQASTVRIRRQSILRVCNEVLEIAIRLFVKIACVLVGYGTATILRGSTAGLAGSLIFFISAVGAFAILRPIAYRLYPELKRSDLQRLRRGPNPKTLAAVGVLAVVLIAFLENIWCAVALISTIVAGTVVAAAIAISNRRETLT
jgi:hypothetical protein